jgi:hypothetical protein
MFRIEMLPAAHGDCLWIEYGQDHAMHRILIDGGPAHTYPHLRERILHLPKDERHFDLLVITHIDADHIEGIIRLLLDAETLLCRFDRIWFNGRQQLDGVPDPAGEALGSVQGEILGMLIADYEVRTTTQVWNREFSDNIVTIDPNKNDLPVITLPGDCRLTLLSPDHQRLLDLKDNWQRELKKARVESGNLVKLRELLENSRSLRPLGDVLGGEGENQIFDLFGGVDEEPLSDVLGGSGEAEAGAAFGSDTSRANGSSIAFLLEYPSNKPEARLLLAGDAWPSVLESSIEHLQMHKSGTRLKVNCFKLPHHGSVANISESLLACLHCSHYLISTNGAIFGHPHTRTIELLLANHESKGKPCLHFNHLAPTTESWNHPKDQQTRRYQAFFPRGLSLTLAR